jgi:hypothetical protein
MLLPDNIHPEQTIYYNAAYVLKVILKQKEISILDLYLEVCKLIKISMPVFLLSLDWLFLAEIIENQENGSVALCS